MPRRTAVEWRLWPFHAKITPTLVETYKSREFTTRKQGVYVGVRMKAPSGLPSDRGASEANGCLPHVSKLLRLSSRSGSQAVTPIVNEH